MALGARALAEYAHVLGERYPVLIALHTDHAPPDRFDAFVATADRGVAPARAARRGAAVSLAHVRRLDAAAGGEPAAFGRAARELAPLGVVLEVESGVVGGEEDGIAGPDGTGSSTRPPRTAARRRGARAPASAAATCWPRRSATSTASMRRATSKLRPELLREGQEALAAARPGARFQYVFHGSSGVRAPMCARRSPTAWSRSTSTPTRSTRSRARWPDHVFANYDGVLRIDGEVGRKAAYDPRSWGAAAEAALARRVSAACELFGSAGRTLLG